MTELLSLTFIDLVRNIHLFWQQEKQRWEIGFFSINWTTEGVSAKMMFEYISGTSIYKNGQFVFWLKSLKEISFGNKYQK